MRKRWTSHFERSASMAIFFGPRKATEYVDIVVLHGQMPHGNQTDLALHHGNLPTMK